MYRFTDKKGSLKEEILRLNGLELSDIEEEITPDFNQDVLLRFKEVLLSYRDKRFFIVGDYDSDGISSTVIMSMLFKRLGISHNYYIPSRIREGYGINKEIVKRAHDYGFEVILTLDNGIVADEAIEYAYSLGLKVLIIDHHEYQDLPQCEAVIHSKMLKEGYKDLCTAGLTCLFSKLFYDDEYTDVLAGIATLADMVSVLGYNRYLIKRALYLLNRGSFPQINILSRRRKYEYDDLSFTVIPRINAVSRLDYNVNMMVKYFLSDSKTCLETADALEKVNRLRKDMSDKMFIKAETLISEDKLTVISDESFHEGLCGITAGKLAEKYLKPCLVLAENDGILKGSGRSWGDFNIHEYLKGCEELFDSFGGHEMALGLSLKKENLPLLKDYIKTHPFTFKETPKDVLRLSVKDLNGELLRELDSLKPFGTGLKEPLYAMDDYKVYSHNLIKDKYPSYILDEGIRAISFKQCEKGKGTMVFKINRDIYDKDKASLIIEDFVL